MKVRVRALAAALDGGLPRRHEGEGPEARLLELASEIERALVVDRLSGDDRERILRRAMTMARDPAASAPGSRPSWMGRVAQSSPGRRLRHPGRVTSAVIGGTAVVAIAAVGATLVRQRRAHGAAA